MATRLLDIPYSVPFVINEGMFVKTGQSVNIDQGPPNQIGSGPIFYRCFEIDENRKKKLNWRWICAEHEVSLLP